MPQQRFVALNAISTIVQIVAGLLFLGIQTHHLPPIFWIFVGFGGIAAIVKVFIFNARSYAFTLFIWVAGVAGIGIIAASIRELAKL